MESTTAVEVLSADRGGPRRNRAYSMYTCTQRSLIP